jgi:uncharacterized membrane protein YqaE (UPF0057 family)
MSAGGPPVQSAERVAAECPATSRANPARGVNGCLLAAGAATRRNTSRKETLVIKVLLVLLCLVLPFLAVLIKDGPSLKVLWAFLLQLCGHIPGVIYGIYQVVKD